MKCYFFYLLLFFLPKNEPSCIKMNSCSLTQNARFQTKEDVSWIDKLRGSSVWPFLAVWADLIGKTPHFLLWFWCDVSLALTPSWTLWELLGIERLIGVFELGDLIECSCHNISNTVYSPIMTQLGHDGHITKKRREWWEKKNWKSTSSAVKWFVFLLRNLPLRPPL